MNLKVILAIDPSGSFKEGKGTTGFAVMKKDSKGRIKVLDHFVVQATHYNRRSAYWEAVLYEIKRFMKKYRKRIAQYFEYVSFIMTFILSGYEHCIADFPFLFFKYIFSFSTEKLNNFAFTIFPFKIY